MNWIAPLARDLKAPKAHPRPEDGNPVLALNLNESPIPPSPLAIAAAMETIAGVNRYPPTDGGALIAALAAHTGLPPARIGVAVGSDMLLHLLCMISLAPGRSAVMPYPSFPRYANSTKIAGGRMIAIEVTPMARTTQNGCYRRSRPIPASFFAAPPTATPAAPWHQKPSPTSPGMCRMM